MSSWAARNTARMSIRSRNTCSCTDGLRVRCPPSGRICAASSRSRPRSARMTRCSGPPSATDPPISPFSARSRAAPVGSQAGDARQMADLRGDARQHRAPQRAVGVAAGEFLEMHDPGEDARRRDIGAPCHRMPGRAVGHPALHQHAGRVARRGADRDQIVEPAEPVPPGQPFGAGVGRKPGRGRTADQLAGEFDVAGQDRVAAPRIARPALVELQPQLGRRRSDQRLAIERRRRPAPARRRPASRANASRSVAARPAARRVAPAPAGGPNRAGFIGARPIARVAAGRRDTRRRGRAVRRLKPSRLVTRKAAPGKRAPHAPAAGSRPRRIAGYEGPRRG